MSLIFNFILNSAERILHKKGESLSQESKTRKYTYVITVPLPVIVVGFFILFFTKTTAKKIYNETLYWKAYQTVQYRVWNIKSNVKCKSTSTRFT